MSVDLELVCAFEIASFAAFIDLFTSGQLQLGFSQTRFSSHVILLKDFLHCLQVTRALLLKIIFPERLWLIVLDFFGMLCELAITHIGDLFSNLREAAIAKINKGIGVSIASHGFSVSQSDITGEASHSLSPIAWGRSTSASPYSIT